METTWERVKEPDDPRRCQAVIQTRGQCMNKAVDGSNFCAAHGGNVALKLAEKEKNRMYALRKWRSTVSKFTDHEELKGLREEVGILRMMLEERLNACQTELDLMLYSGPISDLVMKIEKLVSSCNRMETQLGNVLDKNQALQLAQEMVEIIGRHLDSVPDRTTIEQNIVKLIDENTDRDEFIDAVTAGLEGVKCKEEILEAIADEIASAVDKLASGKFKTG